MRDTYSEPITIKRWLRKLNGNRQLKIESNYSKVVRLHGVGCRSVLAYRGVADSHFGSRGESSEELDDPLREGHVTISWPR